MNMRKRNACLGCEPGSRVAIKRAAVIRILSQSVRKQSKVVIYISRPFYSDATNKISLISLPLCRPGYQWAQLGLFDLPDTDTPFCVSLNWLYIPN